ncbi:argonaute/piwi family protein [Tychonema sp. BBK16]|uniref:argonaute/piwi family protein n=1 Tax=Tychonema sp. BBK16 TaxID=2699888 RepID=UPI0038D282AE
MNDEHDIPKISCQYLGEPLLCFADGKQHIDPKFGVLNFGPKSYSPIKRHPSLVRVGFIGSAETIEIAKQWMEKTAQGVLGDDKHPAFPGFQKERGFFSELVFDDAWIGQLNRSEIEDVLKIKSERECFEAAVKLLESKLNLLSRKDQPPEYVVVALPEQLSKKCRVADYKDTELGDIHMDLRRAFKSVAMKYRIPTQLLNMETVNGRDKDHQSKIAWNFFTGLYFKAGGFPWGPVGLQPGSCYIGISFYRPLGSTFSTMQTSLVQAFDEHGDGLVLRGHEFTWDSKKEGTKSPHLTEEQAIRLVDMVLARYQEEMGQRPKRVVVHKTSRYWPAEKSGFEQALQKYVSQYDLLALIPQNTVRLLIANKYPPLRGTRFTVEDIDYLYTTGFIAELNQFHGMHVPSPIQIADHIGYDTPRETLLKEILILTKMNWNSSRLGGLLPITIRFSRLVGDIMREIPADREPLSNFKFYM